MKKLKLILKLCITFYIFKVSKHVPMCAYMHTYHRHINFQDFFHLLWMSPLNRIMLLFCVHWGCLNLFENSNLYIYIYVQVCVCVCVCVCSLNFLFLQDHFLFLEFEPLFFISLAFLKCLMTLTHQFIFKNFEIAGWIYWLQFCPRLNRQWSSISGLILFRFSLEELLLKKKSLYCLHMTHLCLDSMHYHAGGRNSVHRLSVNLHILSSFSLNL